MLPGSSVPDDQNSAGSVPPADPSPAIAGPDNPASDPEMTPSTVPLHKVPLVTPPVPSGTPTVTVLPVAAPPTGSPAARLLSAVAAVSAADDRTVSLGPGGPGGVVPALVPPVPVSVGARPRLRVLRGLRLNVEYPIYDGPNFIGRRDERPIDIDLEDQEPTDRVWSSRQHAVVRFENGLLTIEDLNSMNGTFVNRARVYPGQVRGLAVNDIVQIGTVQMKVTE